MFLTPASNENFDCLFTTDDLMIIANAVMLYHKGLQRKENKKPLCRHSFNTVKPLPVLPLRSPVKTINFFSAVKRIFQKKFISHLDTHCEKIP